jgi:hypothetical protein
MGAKHAKKSNVQRMTVSIPDDLVTWAKSAAKWKRVSLSRFLADVLKERMQNDGPYDEESYKRAMKSALARKPFLKTDGKDPTREEIYSRPRSLR